MLVLQSLCELMKNENWTEIDSHSFLKLSASLKQS